MKVYCIRPHFSLFLNDQSLIWKYKIFQFTAIGFETTLSSFSNKAQGAYLSRVFRFFSIIILFSKQLQFLTLRLICFINKLGDSGICSCLVTKGHGLLKPLCSASQYNICHNTPKSVMF